MRSMIYQRKLGDLFLVKLLVYILTTLVTIDGVWFGNRTYWTLSRSR
jgi:hypothetical protein